MEIVLGFGALGATIQLLFEWIMYFVLSSFPHSQLKGEEFWGGGAELNFFSLITIAVFALLSTVQFRRKRPKAGFTLLGLALGCGGMFLICSAANGGFGPG